MIKREDHFKKEMRVTKAFLAFGCFLVCMVIVSTVLAAIYTSPDVSEEIQEVLYVSDATFYNTLDICNLLFLLCFGGR